MDIPENGQGLGIIPVVENPLEEVQIRAGGHFLEEVALNQFDALVQTEIVDDVPRLGNHVGAIKQHALGCRICLQQRRQQRAVTAAYINNLLECRDIILRNNLV